MPGACERRRGTASVEEVYQRVVVDDGERAAFAQAVQSATGLASFLAERGCEASVEEVAAFLEGRQGELSEAGLGDISGGGACSSDGYGPMHPPLT